MDISVDMISEGALSQHGTPKQQQSELVGKDPVMTPSTIPAAESPSYSVSSTTPLSQSNNNYTNSGNHHQTLLRVPMPSPSRPRLDPRYAARLPPQPQQQRLRTNSLPESFELMPPPSVYRCDTGQTSLFRPTPVVTPTGPPEACSTSTSSTGSSNSSSSTFSTTDASSGFTPMRPPTKRVKWDYGDRFIPSRNSSNFNFNLWEGISQRSHKKTNYSFNSNSDADGSDHSNRSSSNNRGDSGSSSSSGGNGHLRNLTTVSTTAQQNLLTALMRTEVLGAGATTVATSTGRSSTSSSLPINSNNHLRFAVPRQEFQENVFEQTSLVTDFNLTPAKSPASERLMTTPSKRKRRISKVPFKVLDAPALQDDFYLNLVDWSSQNVLAVGLGSCVYLWSACTSKVTKLCDLSANEDTVTAVSWAQRGTHLSVGTNKGEVQLWDTIKCKKVRSMAGHTARVGTLAWTGPTLASGSRDRLIYLRDVRVQAAFTDKLQNHCQEVCGLKWSFEEPSFLASGGNDNNLHVIDSRNPNDPLHRFSDHNAAVKAIAWSPHQHGLLASGGGTADRCIRFWNTLSGAHLNKVDTGSQVCNLAWSQNCNEIVSTHGYSLNQIIVWRYPSMQKVTTLTGHTYRVLYLAMSPDGSTVVTGAGDETLRFWQIFPGPRSDGKEGAGGLLFPNTIGSVIR